MAMKKIIPMKIIPMKIIPILFLLTGCATAAVQSENTTSSRPTKTQACDLIVKLAEYAADLRLSGVPEYRAYEHLASELDNPSDRDAWAQIVVTVYDLPQRGLSGANRADLMSEAWAGCMGGENGN